VVPLSLMEWNGKPWMMAVGVVHPPLILIHRDIHHLESILTLSLSIDREMRNEK